MQIDRDLRIRLQAAADAALHRALERAGNRLRAKARGNTTAAAKVDGVPGELVAAALGRTLVAALDADDADLLRDAFGRSAASGRSGPPPPPRTPSTPPPASPAWTGPTPPCSGPSPGSATPSPTAPRAAWPALEAQLNDLATGLMYETQPGGGPAGGAARQPGAARRDPRRPRRRRRPLPADHPGFAAAGTFLRPHLRAAPHRVHARRRRGAGGVRVGVRHLLPPVPPHEALDGQVFTDFGDPALSSAGTGGEWVGGTFAPGDHKGCHCDAAVIYADGNTRDEQEIIGRTSYAEQKPGRTVPGWDATVDGKLGTPRARPAP
jgi:hypothetical protein